MALADTANLLVKMNLGGNFLSNIGKATTGLNKFDRKLGQTESRAFRAGQQIGTGIRNAGRLAAVGVGFLVSQVGFGLQSLIDLEKATAQTEAVIKSTGGTAGVTATEVQRLSEKFEALNATVGDEFITAGQNMLLTFTNIRGKAFEPALKAILDINTAMGGGPEGLTKVAIQVGKALNDPIKGVTALRRIGVTFTEDQIKQIKALQKTNDLYGAQKIVLAELNKEFGGSFAAQGDTTAGKVAKFTDAVEDLQRALAEALLPTLGNVADALSKTLADPKVVAGVRDFGQQLAKLVSPENLAEAGSILKEVFNTAKAAAPTIAAAAQIMGQVVGTAVTMFRSLPKEIQQLAIGAFAINKLTGGLVTNLAGGLISGVLKQLVSGVVNVRGASVIVTGGAGIPGTAAGAAAGGGLGLASKVFLVGEAIGLALLVNEVRNGISQGNTNAAKALTEQSRIWLAQKLDRKALEQGLAGVEAGILEIARTDPQGLVQGESLAELKAIRQAILDRLKPELFGPPTPTGVVRPTVVDSPRTSATSLANLEAILTRGRAAGFKPTLAAAQATNQKNMERLASQQIDKTEAVRVAILAGDTRSELAGIAAAVAAGQKPVGLGTVASQMEDIQRRAIEAGFRPSAEAIQLTFDKNKQHLIDIKNAVAAVGTDIRALPTGFMNSLGGILYQGGGRAEKDDVFVPPGWPPAPPPIDRAAIEAIIARGRAAGFSPTVAAAQQTHQRNLSRLAEAQLVKTEAVRAAVVAGDTRAELAGIRNAVATQTQVVPIVNVNVNVTPAAIQKSTVIQYRYGKPNGSRGHAAGTGPLP